MATKAKGAKPNKTHRNSAKADTKSDGDLDAQRAHRMLRPECLSAALIKTVHGDGLEINATVREMNAQVQAVQRGDMTRPEAMLVAQAHALNCLFTSLSLRSEGNLNKDFLEAGERYMRLALKAQSQCRATLETLAAIKNPPVVYARQANVTSGPQQINNGMLASSQAGEIENQPNKLLEAQHGNYVDTGTARATSGADSELATVGEIDRAKVRRG
jgi:hypothetical protein